MNIIRKNDFYKNLTFLALERKKNATKGFMTMDGRVFSSFSGHMKNLDKAMDFLNRNGAFWKKRGVKLFLFRLSPFPELIGHAEGKNLILHQINPETKEPQYSMAV